MYQVQTVFEGVESGEGKDMQDLGFEAFIFRGSDGGPLPFRRMVMGKDLPGPYTMVLLLHGAGSLGHNNWAQLRVYGPPVVKYLKRKPQKVVLLLPHCDEGNKWVDVNWSSTAHTLSPKPSVYMQRCMEMLDEQIAEFKPARILGSGASMGGYGIWDIASRRPELFEKIAPICGGGDTACAERLKHVKVYMVHGDKDTAVPVVRSRSMFEAMKSVHADPVYHEIPGLGHNAWDIFLGSDEGLDWLFS